MNVLSQFHDPLGLKNVLKLNCMISEKFCTQESLRKQTGCFQSHVWFWRAMVFNKGYILSVFVCAVRERIVSEADGDEKTPLSGVGLLKCTWKVN